MVTTGYRIDNPIQKKFFQNSKFCLCVQEYLQNLLSIQIAIIPDQSSKTRWHTKKVLNAYRIHVLDTHENKTEIEQTISDVMKNLFNTIQSEIFTNDQVKEWLQNSSIKQKHIKCLEKILNEKLHHIFTICEEDPKYSLKIYYLSKEFSTIPDNKEINKIIEHKISQEIILLPYRSEYSKHIIEELKKIIEKKLINKEISVSFLYDNSNMKTIQKKIIIFGYYKIVDQLKKDLLEIIERYNVNIFKLNLFDTYQTEFIMKTCFKQLRKIEKKYKQFGVNLRLRLNEFSSPSHLKNEIESSIKQLLSNSKTLTFKSIPLFKNITQIAEKHLKSIAHKNHCYITTELKYKSHSYTIPKSFSSNTQILQSDDFIFSPDVFKTIPVGNGSIEIRIGDIALQKVDTIVISNTTNGLKEGVIERAGTFDYERTYTDETGLKFIETNGGKLFCKRILFSNWLPLEHTHNDNDLRKSINIFMSKSIKCALKEQTTKSIAFAITDSCKNESILAEEMINVVKEQLQSKNLQLNISFILLPEQQSLYRQFFNIIGETSDIYAQFDWQTTVIKITLKASNDEDLLKCQDKINNYLNRCITSIKLVNSNGIFHQCDQYIINKFYKYCQDKCVLPQIDHTGKELELIGFINSILEVKQKWHVLHDLAIEKFLHKSTTDRLSSATIRSVQVDNRTNNDQTNTYHIMLSYCQQDRRKCQRLIKRFTEEGLSLWTEPIINEQQRDISSQINKSACILLCISENSYENQSCEKEAKYVLQTSIPVFLLKIQNRPLIGWQRDLFEGKLFFQLFGSENYFDLQCDNLLLKILQSIKSNFISRQQQKLDHTQLSSNKSQDILTMEQLRSKYDRKIRRLTKIGHIEETEMTILIQQLHDIINDTDHEENKSDEQNQENNNDQQNEKDNSDKSKHISNYQFSKYYEWIERWLRKPTNITKQNLSPFTASGDINDAVFPMPEYVLQQLGLYDQSLLSTQSPTVKLQNIFECSIIKRPIERPLSRDLLNQLPVDKEHTYGKYTEKIEYFNGLSQIFPDCYSSSDNDMQKRERLPCLPAEILTHNNLSYSGKRKNVQKETGKCFVKKYERPTREELEVYFKQFAERMNENAIQFEKFCTTTMDIAQSMDQTNLVLKQ